MVFLFFRRQGFRMITFDRQAGPLQNFNRSHVMVIRKEKCVCMRFRTPGTFLNKKFSREKNLEIFRLPPPPFFFFCVLRLQEDVFAEKNAYPHYWLFDAVTNILTWVAHWLYIPTTQQDACIYMHTTLWDITTYLGHGHSSLLIIWCSDQYTYMSCVHLCVCHDNILSVMIAIANRFNYKSFILMNI